MSDDAPKRSYELAMERLRKKDHEAGGDDRPLTDAQKSAIAEVRQFHKAKSAELEILHQAALRKATTHEEIDQLNENLRRDSERLAGERDRKIDEIRKSAVSCPPRRRRRMMAVNLMRRVIKLYDTTL